MGSRAQSHHTYGNKGHQIIIGFCFGENTPKGKKQQDPEEHHIERAARRKISQDKNTQPRRRTGGKKKKERNSAATTRSIKTAVLDRGIKRVCDLPVRGRVGNGHGQGAKLHPYGDRERNYRGGMRAIGADRAKRRPCTKRLRTGSISIK